MSRLFNRTACIVILEEKPQQVIMATNRFLNLPEETMKIRYLLLTLVGLATGLALPIFAQEPNAPDPQLREQPARIL